MISFEGYIYGLKSDLEVKCCFNISCARIHFREREKNLIHKLLFGTHSSVLNTEVVRILLGWNGRVPLYTFIA